MQTTIKFFVSCFLCLALLFVSGCGSGDNATTGGGSTSTGTGATSGGGSPHPAELVGNWVEADAPPDYDEYVLTLSKDGTGTFEGVNVTWKVEGGRLHISFMPPANMRLLPGEYEPMAVDYKISGTTLSFILDGKTIDSFTKR